MPIYEYVCQECGERYEKFVRSSLAKVELKCPKCGSTQATKAFSVFGVQGGGSQSFQTAASSAAASGPIG
ncbi:MAG: zinc ribbon domain-containing protein [Anaerolineales bacterium]|nr:MAG: zinc ribbon domain-containing protein [Anaerolineales bacterium]